MSKKTKSRRRPLETDQTVLAAGDALSHTIVETSGRCDEAPSPSTLHPVDPTHYELGDEIAKGGMGRIVEGYDNRIGRPVAIKEVLAKLLEIYPDIDRDLLLRRFEREARITARLQHPSIVPVYEIGQINGSPFFAMKKVEGRPLGQLIDEATTFADKMRLLPRIVAVCDALGFAHGRGVVHRDLKPSNILVGEHGETVVIDWGLAKQTDSDDEAFRSAPPVMANDDGLQTTAGSIFGTPLYMPPEQALGLAVDTRADVYSLGSILYHVFAGRAPYLCSGEARKSAILEQLKNGPPPPLEESAPQVPSDLLAIIEKAMARETSNRYPNAEALAAELRDFEAGKLVETYEYSLRELALRWIRRHRAAIATAAIALVALVGAGVLFVQSLSSEKERAQEQRSLADDSSRRSVELFAKMGRRALLENRLFDATFSLVQAKLLGDDSRLSEIALGEVERSMDHFVARIGSTPTVGAIFAAGGEEIVTGFFEGEIVFAKTVDGEVLATFKHRPGMLTLSGSSDGSVVLATHKGGVADLWNVRTRERVATFKCEKRSNRSSPIARGELSRDGRIVALACWQDQLKLFDADSEKLLASSGYLPSNAYVSFSKDGTTLLVSGLGTEAAILSVPELRKLVGPVQLSSRIGALDSSDDHSRVFTVNSESMAFFDPQTGRRLSTVISEGLRVGTLSPDGSVAVVGAADGNVSIIDAETGKRKARWNAHGAAVSAIEFSDDGQTIATLSNDLVVRFWDIASGRLRSSALGLTSGAAEIRMGPSHAAVLTMTGLLLFESVRDDAHLVSRMPDHRVVVGPPGSDWILLTGNEESTLVHADRSIDIADVPSGNSGALGDLEGKYLAFRRGVYEIKTGKNVAPVADDFVTDSAGMSQDGTTAFFISRTLGVRVLDVKTGKLRLSLPGSTASDGPSWASISPTGNTLAVATLHKAVTFYDIEAGQPIREYPGIVSRTHSGGEVILAHFSDRIAGYDAETGAWLYDVNEKRNLGAVAVEGETMALTTISGFDFWSTKTGRRTGRLNLEQETNAIRRTRISGDRLTGWTLSGEVRVWDLESSELVFGRQVSRSIYDAVADRDGRMVYIATAGGIHRYSLAPPKRTIRELLLRLATIFPPRFFESNFLIWK